MTSRLGLASLGALTLLRLTVAAVAPLAPDEAYYWVWSRALAPGYPDHPPMVALWVRLGTFVAGDTPLGIRLLGPLSAALASLLLADAAECLLPGRRAGLWSAALLNATLMLGVGAVANIGIAQALYETHTAWSIAGAIGAVIGVVWNYAVSATLVWRAR